MNESLQLNGTLGRAGQAAILFCLLLIIGLMSGCQPGNVQGGSTAAQVFISPEVSGGSGTQEDPFGSIQQALESVKQMSLNADTITFTLFGGKHRLTEPIPLVPSFTGYGKAVLRFAPFPGTKPSIVGSSEVTDWQLHDANLNIYKASIDPSIRSRQLYVDGKRTTRARTPRWPKGFAPTSSTDPKQNGIRYQYFNWFNPKDNPENWSHPENIQAVQQMQWRMMSIPVKSVIGKDVLGLDHGLITIQEPAWSNSQLYLDSKGEAPGMWSFWRVTFFENCYEFLDEPGEWFLEEGTGTVYYIPLENQNMATATAEIPVLEKLVEGWGNIDTVLENVLFEDLTFEYATWNSPDGPTGYVSDQSGFFVVGQGNTNITGHVKVDHLQKTPGALSFDYAHNITFRGCTFRHLGSNAIAFGLGCQNNTVDRNTFEDLSSAAVQIGAVGPDHHHPSDDRMILKHHTVTNNTITSTAVEYVDAAAIYAGFTAHTDISFNSISGTNWAGIAMGWGWGLLDTTGFPGIGGAKWFEWGRFSKPTPNSHNQVTYNRVEKYVENRWDAGLLYCCGQQGQGPGDSLLIKGNVASNKRSTGGANTIYTDGGSRYVKVIRNASYDNPPGIINMSPPINPTDLLKPSQWKATWMTELKIAYGGDCGGCRTFGGISWRDNYWNQTQVENKEWWSDVDLDLLRLFVHDANLDSLRPYSPNGFFNVCPYTDTITGITYPNDTLFSGNHNISGIGDIPQSLLDSAGVNP